MLKFRKSMLAALCAATVGIIALPLPASAQVNIYFNVAPPPVRYEVVPAPRQGYVWSSGYWNARGSRHVWQAGHWERDRAGYQFAQPTWTQQGDRWELERGRWKKGKHDSSGAHDEGGHASGNPHQR